MPQVILASSQPDAGSVHLTLRSLAAAGVSEVILAAPAQLPSTWGGELQVTEAAHEELASLIRRSEQVLLLTAGCLVPRSLLALLKAHSQSLQTCHPLLSNDGDVHRVPPSGGDCDTVQHLLSHEKVLRKAAGKSPHALYCNSGWLAEQVPALADQSWLTALPFSEEVLPIYVYRAATSLTWPGRSFVSAFSTGPTRWSPKPAVWEMGRELRAYRQGAVATSAARTENRWQQLTRSRREVAAAPATEGALRITYVLQDLLIAGGVLSVVQLVNELNLLGVDARIAASFEDPKVYRWLPFVRRPMIYANSEDLLKNLPECDLLVATFWTTAPLVRRLLDEGRAGHAAYFVQGYDANFYPDSPATRAQAESTYRLLDTRIVKSDWLAAKLADLGCATHKIALGMDLDLFRPGPFLPERPLVLALARPEHALAEFDALIGALAKVKAARPEATIVLFGSDNLTRRDIPFAFEDLGIVHDRATMVDWYHKASVLVDLCATHGFGRCGLEAMACGTPCVLSATGGVLEYAIHERNALLVDSADNEQAAGAVLRLLQEGQLPQQLRNEGLETARYYDKKAEAKRTKAFFRDLLN